MLPIGLCRWVKFCWSLFTVCVCDCNFFCFVFVFLCLQTLHRASIAEPEKNWPEFEPMRPYHKEETVLGFSLDMVRETCLDKDEENSKVLEESQWESGYTDGNSFTDEEILLVSMSNTSVAIVQARGCDPQNPCNSCGRTGCSLSDYVMDNTQCKVTGESFIMTMLSDSLSHTT